MCSEPADSAIESFRQVRKRNETVAPISSRICTCGAAGLPTLSTLMVLADLREKFAIQPRSIHGAGGASRLNWPFDGRIEDRWLFRLREFTGAKYARTLRVSGVVGVVYVTAAVLIALPAPGMQRR